jgi:hypothetical protein
VKPSLEGERPPSAEIASPEAVHRAGGDQEHGGREEAGPGRDDGQDGTVGAGAVAAQWGQIVQELKDRKQALTATVFAEGLPSSFDDDVLEITFPKESDFYVKEAGKPRHGEALGEILESRFGIRPRLEFRVTGADRPANAGPPSMKPPAEEANEGTSPARPQTPRDVFETALGTAPEPEAKTPRHEISEGAAPVPEVEDGLVEETGERIGADDTIQDLQEVLVIARERFGLDRRPSGEKQNGGS